MNAPFIWILMYFWKYSIFKKFAHSLFCCCDYGHFVIKKWKRWVVCGHIVSISGKLSRSSDSQLGFFHKTSLPVLTFTHFSCMVSFSCPQVSKGNAALCVIAAEGSEVKGSPGSRWQRNSYRLLTRLLLSPSLPAAFENTLLESNSFYFKCSKVGKSCGFLSNIKGSSASYEQFAKGSERKECELMCLLRALRMWWQSMKWSHVINK